MEKTNIENEKHKLALDREIMLIVILNYYTRNEI